jgi:hypothetical protein
MQRALLPQLRLPVLALSGSEASSFLRCFMLPFPPVSLHFFFLFHFFTFTSLFASISHQNSLVFSVILLILCLLYLAYRFTLSLHFDF